MTGSSSPPGPVLGPCTSWLSGEEVAACCATAELGSSGDGLDDVAATASMILYEMSGRQFAGSCSRTVRPCRTGCGCWGSQSPIIASQYIGWSDLGGYWRDSSSGDTCGCSPLSVVTLEGYPVTEVTEVLIDGVAIDPSVYRLDDWRSLVYLADPGPPVVHRFWPSCQDLSLDSSQPGTFEVTYSYGVNPPQIGKDAAAVLACELWSACPENGGKCRLPGRVTRVVRQGITYDRVAVLAELLRQGATGIPQIDAFIGTYNPNGLRRRPAVYSPDVPQYPRKVGP